MTMDSANQRPVAPHDYIHLEDVEASLDAYAVRVRWLLESLAVGEAATEQRVSSPDQPILIHTDHVRRAAETLANSPRSLATAWRLTTFQPITANVRGAGTTPDTIRDKSTERSVFVSYAGAKPPLVKRLFDMLKKQGVDAFAAHWSIQPGEEWVESIRVGLLQCHVFVPIVTPKSLQSNWCKYELGAAVVLQKVILPVLLRGSFARLPDIIQRFHGMLVRKSDDLNQLVDRLVDICRPAARH